MTKQICLFSFVYVHVNKPINSPVCELNLSQLRVFQPYVVTPPNCITYILTFHWAWKRQIIWINLPLVSNYNPRVPCVYMYKGKYQLKMSWFYRINNQYITRIKQV